MLSQLCDCISGDYILDFVRKNRKTLEHNILSGRSKKLAFPMLAVIVLITIGCQADRELTKSQREDVIAPVSLSSQKTENAKENHISASENASHLYKEQERQTELRQEKNLGADKKHTSLKATKLKYEENVQEFKIKKSPPPSDKKILKIGILLPLSGNSSQIGRALLDSIQLAFFEVPNHDLELLIFDTKGSAEGAKEAGELAINSNVDLILGPLFGSSTRAISPITKEAGIKVISFSNDHLVAEEGTYIFGFLPNQQIIRIVNFAIKSGYKNFAAFVPDNDYGKLAVETSRAAVDSKGTRLSRAEHYDPESENLTDLVKSFADYKARKNNLKTQKERLLKQKDEIAVSLLNKMQSMDTLGDPPFDALLLPTGGPELKKIAPLLAFYDVDPSRVKLLGTTLWDETADLNFEPALIGGWYVAPAPKGVSKFIEKFKRNYGYAPPRLASLGYDAMLLGVALSESTRTNGISSFDIHNPRGFTGVDGIIRLLPDGTNERGFAVLEIGKKGPIVVEDAPTRFWQ